jgi:hypothetical protein
MKKLLGILVVLVLTTGSSSAQAPGGNVQGVRPGRIRIPERSLLQRDRLRMKLMPGNSRREEVNGVEEKKKMRKARGKAPAATGDLTQEY